MPFYVVEDFIAEQSGFIIKDLKQLEIEVLLKEGDI